MPLIEDKKAIVRAVATIVDVDMGILDKIFTTPHFHNSETIEYDEATIEGVNPHYNSFRNQANVVKKDGFDTVKINPVNFNEAISKGAIEAYARRFGENIYGDNAGNASPMTRSLLNGIGKLDLRRRTGMKKLGYEALMTHKIAGGYSSVDGVKDIIFNVPAENKEVLDDVSNLFWTNPLSNPLEDMYRAWKNMKIKPEMATMNDATYGYFYGNTNVMTADNSTSGRMKNFIINEAADSGNKGYRAGKVMYKGMNIDVWVEPTTYIDNTSGSDVKYLSDNYVIYTSARGEKHFGGIPTILNGEVGTIAAEFDVQEIVTENPVAHDIIYKSAPLLVPKEGKAFYSQKVGA